MPKAPAYVPIVETLKRNFPTVVQAFDWWWAGLALPDRRAAPTGMPQIGAHQASAALSVQDRDRAAQKGLALVVPDAEWLTLTANFPAASREDQMRMAAFEIAEQTPLEPGDVWFDLAPAGDGYHVHVVPKTVTAMWEDEVANTDIAITWLISESREYLRLPQIGGGKRARRPLQIAGLVLGAVLLFVVLQSLQSQRLERLETRRATAAPLAAETRQIETKIAALRASTGDGDGAAPSRVAVLERITTLVPDTTFLTELVIDQDTVRLSGQGTEIEALVRALEADEMLSQVRILGALRTDPSGVSTFQIGATLP